MSEVILKNVSKSYMTGVKKQEVLKGVDLEVETGGFVILNSTMLSIIENTNTKKAIHM